VRLELFIALRYLLARRRQAFISVISLISTIGVAVGVMALVVALALMTGLHTELRDRILGSTAHIYFGRIGGLDDYRPEVKRLLQVDGVAGAAPAISDTGLIRSDTADSVITIKGVDPALEPTVTEVAGGMKTGRFEALNEISEEGTPGIVLGELVARNLDVAVGDRVTLLFIDSVADTFFGAFPRPRVARVIGTYSVGLQEFDEGYGFVSLEFARKLTQNGQQIQLRLHDADRAPAIARAIEAEFGEAYYALEWQSTNQLLFSALWLEKAGLSLAVGLIVAVAALNIVASLILLVMEKSRDIAILKTMGLSPPRVMRVFMFQGLIIGLVGTSAGGGLGLLASWALDRYQIIKISMDVYQVAHLPFVVRPLDFALVMLSAVVICFVATVYPSRRAARLDPVQALRFE
jgi:lipoprotein-releasing system permease protein